MKKKEIDTRGLVRTRYVSPGVKAVKIKSHGVLCQSGKVGTEGFDDREDVTDDWFNE